MCVGALSSDYGAELDNISNKEEEAPFTLMSLRQAVVPLQARSGQSARHNTAWHGMARHGIA